MSDAKGDVLLDRVASEIMEEVRDPEERSTPMPCKGCAAAGDLKFNPPLVLALPLHFSFQLRVKAAVASFVASAIRFGCCWLYIHVALSTIAEPRTNVNVIWKSNKAIDAKNEMTMLKDVANPLRMLSEYLMTMAVTRPPNTCIPTVAHAHGPKLRNSEENQPEPVLVSRENRIGIMAGRRENKDS